jgi:hypothetical protein
MLANYIIAALCQRPLTCHIQEQIELERLVLEGNELIRTMQERGVELKNDQLPINAIVRCPLLAIRWRLPNQKVTTMRMQCELNSIPSGSSSTVSFPVQ